MKPASQSDSRLQSLAADLVAMAKAEGAAHADALAIADSGNSVAVRHGKVESVEREDGRGIGLRAFVETATGFAFASASTSDVSPQGMRQLAAQVVAMARISEADPDAVPPVGAEHPDEETIRDWLRRHPDTDPGWNLDRARDAALECEALALDYAPEISNSEGANASFGSTDVAYAASDGFVAGYSKSSASLSVSVIAGKGEGMQRDYAWHRALAAAKLKSTRELAVEAAERAVRRLGATGMASGPATVVFEPRVAASLASHLVSAINGRAVLQQRSFLADANGTAIFPACVNILDDPDHAEGLGNRLFDGEGTICRRRHIIERGVLTGFLTDRYAAKRLNCPATGHARRGLTGDIGIGPSNLIWEPGDSSLEDIIAGIGHGVLITELIGFGVNGVTGDYSRGAAGFLIQGGRISGPVQGITIAGNLKSMFAAVMQVGSDLTWFGSTAVPSLAVEGMTVAGE